eukprot:scaffold25036_cov166-Cylindrotheca_fusiformis.AAC.1
MHCCRIHPNNKNISSRSRTSSSNKSNSMRRRYSLKRALAVSLMMAQYNITPADCFGGVASHSSTTTSSSSPRTVITKQFYTVDENVSSTQSFSNPLLHNNNIQQTNNNNKLPSWLRVPQAPFVDERMESLRQAMVNSFFTEPEILKLKYAIQEASGGDLEQMAGAAAFCTLLVETMEMGLYALLAATFHYCSCVEARHEQSHPHDLTPYEESSLFKLQYHPSTSLHQHTSPSSFSSSFGTHVMQIERDAARLKRLEMVAASHHTAPAGAATVAHNLRNLFLTEAKDWRALAIRAAACLYRLQGILQNSTKEERRTKENNHVCREAFQIYAPLASRLGMHRLKNELEEAAFQILYPRQYDTVTSLLQQTRSTSSTPKMSNFYSPARRRYSWKPDIGESMEKILTQVQAEITEILENDAEFDRAVQDFTVTARVKEAYSTWKKMLRHKLDHILQVPDAIALRIVLNASKKEPNEPEEVIRARERALCYYAQELCLQRWAPAPEDARFKDYIAKPKANGYQSLHYTATTNWQGEVWSMEIQVRSGEMHNVAEYGVASHWDYKTRGGGGGGQSTDHNNNNNIRKDEYTNDHNAPEGQYSSMTINEHFGRVVMQQNSDAYLRFLQEYHWRTRERSASDALKEEEEVPVSWSFSKESHLRAERIRARTQRLAPYIEALTTAQSDLEREHVYVFLSQDDIEQDGAVLALPAGAVVLDVLNQIDHSFLKEKEDCILHNGSPARLTSRLTNGDVLSIPSMVTTTNM